MMWFVMHLADSNVPPCFDPAIWIAVSTHSFELRKDGVTLGPRHSDVGYFVVGDPVYV
jgi:hypothetical protein